VLGRERNQRTGRDGAPVHVRDGRHLGVEQRIADLHRGIHAPAEGVDLEHHRRRAGGGRFIEHALHKGREAQVDDAFDRRDIDEGSCGRTRRHQRRNHQDCPKTLHRTRQA
jgi:hypothetical protein